VFEDLFEGADDISHAFDRPEIADMQDDFLVRLRQVFPVCERYVKTVEVGEVVDGVDGF